jgi:hypothetical protein
MQVIIIFVIAFIALNASGTSIEKDVKLVQKMIHLVQQFRAGSKTVKAVKGPDSEGLKGPDSEGLKGPDSEGLKGPDSEGLKGPDSEGLQGPDGGEFKGPDSGGLEGPDGGKPKDKADVAVTKDLGKGTEVKGDTKDKEALKEIASDEAAAKAILDKMNPYLDDESRLILLKAYSLEQIGKFYEKFEKDPAFGYALARANFFRPADLECYKEKDAPCMEKNIRAALTRNDGDLRVESRRLPFRLVLEKYHLQQLIAPMPTELVPGDADQWKNYEEAIFKADPSPIIPIIRSFGTEKVPLGIINFDKGKESSFNEAAEKIKKGYDDSVLNGENLPAEMGTTQILSFIEATNDKVGLAVLLTRVVRRSKLKTFTQWQHEILKTLTGLSTLTLHPISFEENKEVIEKILPEKYSLQLINEWALGKLAGSKEVSFKYPLMVRLASHLIFRAVNKSARTPELPQLRSQAVLAGWGAHKTVVSKKDVLNASKVTSRNSKFNALNPQQLDDLFDFRMGKNRKEGYNNLPLVLQSDLFGMDLSEPEQSYDLHDRLVENHREVWGVKNLAFKAILAKAPLSILFPAMFEDDIPPKDREKWIWLEKKAIESCDEKERRETIRRLSMGKQNEMPQLGGMKWDGCQTFEQVFYKMCNFHVKGKNQVDVALFVISLYDEDLSELLKGNPDISSEWYKDPAKSIGDYLKDYLGNTGKGGSL